MTHDIKPGDSVRTVNQMYFVEATNPQTGETIETRFPRGHRLTVVGVNPQDDTIDVQLPDGFVATLPSNDLEP